MNYTITRRLLALLLALSLTLGLAACGDGETETSESEATTTAVAESAEEYGYVTQVQDLGVDFEYVSNVTVQENSLYCCGAVYNEQAENDDYAVAVLDMDGSLQQAVTLPAPPGDAEYQEIAVGGGAIWAVTYEWIEGTEEATEEDTEWIYEETQDEVDNCEIYTLYKFDMDGQEIAQVRLEAPEDLALEYFNVNYMTADSGGDVLISCEEALLVYNEDLELVLQTTVGNWIYGFVPMPDGTVLVEYDDGDSDRLIVYDPETMALGDDVALNTGNYSYEYYPSQTGELYADNSLSLYKCDLESGTLEWVLDWLDYDIDATNLYGVVSMENGNILILGIDSLTYEVQMTWLERVRASEVPEKTEVVLGVSSLTDAIRTMVLSFNRANSEYRITIRDYSAYITDENTSAWLDQMELDMLTGDCPDLFYIGSWRNLQPYIRKGYLTDLYTLMSEDTVTKDDLVSGYLAATEVDGGLYTISPAFYLQTVVASAETVGTEPGWTLDEFISLAEQYTEDGQGIWGEMDREEFLTTILSTCRDNFIDAQTGQCSFDGEAFLSLLEVSLLFPDSSDETTVGDEAVSVETVSYEPIREGTQLVSGLTIYSLNDMCYSADEQEALADDMTLIGYPGAAGSGAVVRIYEQFAISAYSEYQDVAWEFLATLLTEEYAEQNVYQISVLRSYLETQAEEAMEIPYYYDENGEKVEYSDDYLTQEQVDKILAVVENVQCSYYYDETLIDIVLEETAAYFAGQKDAETVAAIIQDRVQTYLDEQG